MSIQLGWVCFLIHILERFFRLGQYLWKIFEAASSDSRSSPSSPILTLNLTPVMSLRSTSAGKFKEMVYNCRKMVDAQITVVLEVLLI